jgi:dolichol-phosphate mannosyltransferase
VGTAFAFARWERLVQFVKFCLVGGSGVFVDMGMLFLLADPKCLGLNLTLSKVLAAETALANNFLWNELWTFRSTRLASDGGRDQSEGRVSLSSSNEETCPPLGSRGAGVRSRTILQPSTLHSHQFSGILCRFLLFNAICGLGIGLAVLLLHLFHTWLGWNRYVSNLLAIILVTCWNFGMNTKFSWGLSKAQPEPSEPADD